MKINLPALPLQKSFLCLLFTLFAFCPQNAAAQSPGWQWVKHIDGTGSINVVDCAVDANDNIYASGSFYGTVDFDPGPGIFNLTAASPGYEDIFLSKSDSAGNFIWALRLGGSLWDGGASMALDAAGNIYTTGYFRGTVDFDPGPGVFNLTHVPGQSTYLSSYDSAGNFLWAKAIGGSGMATLVLDAQKNILLTGNFTHPMDFDPGPGIFNLTPVGAQDIVVYKLDSAGNFDWAKSMGGSDSYGYGFALILDSADHMYVTGAFTDTTDFDPGIGEFNLPADGRAMFVAKLDTAGNLVWAKEMIGATGDPQGFDIALDAAGNVYTTGEFSWTIDFDPGLPVFNLTSYAFNANIFVSKLDSAGNFIWAKGMVGPGNYCNGHQLIFDPSDNGDFYLAGAFRGTIDFDPDSVTNFNLTAAGNADFFISRFDSSGHLIWAKAMGGTGNDVVPGITLSTSGNLLVTGSFYNSTLVFDSTLLTNSDTTGSTADCFLAKLSCSSTAHLYPVACNSYISPGGQTWTESGTYYETIPGGTSCDNIFVIHLTIQNSASTQLVSACSTYVSPSGNDSWNTSGTYQDTLPNVAGCDSLITIHLTIQNSASTQTVSACSTYISPSGNYSWNTSGTYQDTLPNMAGCDSLITIHLTIQNSASAQTLSACGSFASPSGNYTWTSSGTYSDTLPNVSGCDSILTVYLTILNSSFSSLAETACRNYNSPSGHYSWTTSGIYTDTLPNAAGCDSVLTIQLTIINIDTAVIQNGAELMALDSLSSYQWLDCSNGFSAISGETNRVFNVPDSGTFAVALMQNGCLDTSGCHTVSCTCVGIDEINFGNNLSIFPNPAQNELSVISKLLTGRSELEIDNILGQMMLKEGFVISKEIPFKIDISSLAAGIYFLKLKSEGTTVTKKFSVDK